MRKALVALLFLLLPPGCAYSPLHTYYRGGITRRLPDNVNLEDYVETDIFGRRISLDEKLAELGTYPDADGYLRDGAGKRIEVLRALDEYDAPPEVVARERERRAELRKTARLIEVHRQPPAPPAATEPAATLPPLQPPPEPGPAQPPAPPVAAPGWTSPAAAAPGADNPPPPPPPPP